MKKTKKALAYLLSVSMMLGMTLPASASTNIQSETQVENLSTEASATEEIIDLLDAETSSEEELSMSEEEAEEATPSEALELMAESSLLHVNVHGGYSNNRIEWQHIENANTYIIQVKNENGTFTDLDRLSINSTNQAEIYKYWHRNLGLDVTKTYRVKALNGSTELLVSSEVEATTSEEGLEDAAILYKEYTEDDNYFDGTRADDLSVGDSELTKKIIGAKDGTVIIKFKPDKGVVNSQVLFAVKNRDEVARKLAPATNLKDTRTAALYLWGEANKTFRFALGHTQANTAADFSEGEWHTVVFSNTSTGTKILRVTADGVERKSFGNPAGNKGLFSRIAGINEEDAGVLIGGLLQPNNTTVRNGFKGKIHSVLFTEELFTDAQAIKLSEAIRTSNSTGLFNEDSGNTWVFTGGNSALAKFEDIQGRKSFATHFEEAIRWDFRINSAVGSMERFVIDTSKEDATIVEIKDNYDKYIASYSPKAVHLMLSDADIENADATIEALKEIITANTTASRYTVISSALPSADTDVNEAISAFNTKLKAELENLSADEKEKLTLINHFEIFKNLDTSEFLTDNGAISAKGHLKIAKNIIDATAERNFSLAESELESLETKQHKIVDAIPEVLATATGLKLSNLSNLGIDNAKYEIYLSDNRKISGDASSDTVEVDGISGANNYVLVIKNDELRTSYIYGSLEAGNIGTNSSNTNNTALQEELAQKLAQKAEGAKWLFIGDSITQGAGSTGGYDTLVQLFAKYLHEDLDRKNDVVINTAVNGSKLSDFEANKEARYEVYKDADVVSIMLGTNDALAYADVDTFKETLKATVDEIKANNAIPVLRIPTSLPSGNENLLQYALAVYEVAGEKNVLVVNHFGLWESEKATANYLVSSKYIQSDLINPSARGHLLMTRQFIGELGLDIAKSKVYDLDYPIKHSKTRIGIEPQISNTDSSITVNPRQLSDLAMRGEFGKLRILASADEKTYEIEAYRKADGSFSDVILDKLPKTTYDLVVEADLYDRPETIIFKNREVSLDEERNENPQAKILNIEDVKIKGTSISTINVPNKANEIKALDSATIHFRYRSNEHQNSSNGLQALMGFTDSSRLGDIATFGAFYINPNANSLGVEFKNNGTIAYSKAVSNVNIKDKNWHNLTYVYEASGKLKIYLDGDLVLEDPNAKYVDILNSCDILKIGEIGRTTNKWSFNGDIDIARVYDRSLSEEEVMELHEVSDYLNNGTGIPETAVKTEDQSLFYTGYAGSNNYRIPSLFTTKNGVVIAGIDKRNTWASDNGNIDTAIRRSTDNGQTFEEIQVVYDIPGRGDGNLYPFLIDPVMFQDEETGRLFLMVDMLPESGGLFNPAANELGDGKVSVNYNGTTKKYHKLRNRTTNEVFFIDDEGVVRKVSDNSATTYTVPDYYQGKLFNNGTYAGSIFIYGNGNNHAGDLTVDKTAYLWLMHSDDDGLTWSKPYDISDQVKAPWMSFLGLGPGVGMQIKNGPHKGRLVVSVYSINPYGGLASSQAAHVIYSDDNGRTWHRGESVVDGNLVGGERQNSQYMEEPQNQVTESQVVEVGDNGVLKMFSRNTDPRRRVRISTSYDGGETWKDDIEFDDALVEPYCMLSVVRYPTLIDGREAYVFSNPATTNSRSQGTVRVGFYNKDTDKFEWEHSKLIKPGSFAYSCATVMKNGHIGVLYENNASDIRFTSMSMDWLMYENTVTRDLVNITDIAMDRQGNVVDLEVSLDQPVVKFGEASLKVLVDGVEKEAAYVSGEGSDKLLFRYIKAEGEEELKTVSIPAKKDGFSFIGNANNKPIREREFTFSLVTRIPWTPLDPATPIVVEPPVATPSIPLVPLIPATPTGNGNSGGTSIPLVPLTPATPNGNNGGTSIPLVPLTPATPNGNTNTNAGSGSAGSGGSGSSSRGNGFVSAKTNTGFSNLHATYNVGVDGNWKLLDANKHMWVFELNNGTRVTGFANLAYTHNGTRRVETYNFAANGVMNSGWYKDANGKWYYLSENHDGFFGHVVKGWYKDSKDGKYYYLNINDGSMATGWIKLADKWYYLSATNNVEATWQYNALSGKWEYKGNSNIRPLGSLYVNEKTPDGYTVNAEGVWLK